MNCDRCQQAMASGEEAMLHGQALCEDCYMDAFSPARTCDPWAVRSAKHCTNSEGSATESAVQEKILAILRETGGTSIGVLAEQLDLKPADIQREIAALRHMEKVRGALLEGQKVFRLW
ncbi:MAG: hypothetical protein WC256_07670 [Desulfurivibrionaceae bacterium]|jgi:hypothetical protein